MIEKLNGEQIVELLEESGIGVSDWAYEGLGAFDEDEENHPEILRKLGRVIEETQEGGEGQGDTWFVVYYFVDHDVFIRTDGFYSSYDGTSFEDGFGYAVKPKQQMITVYEGV